MTVFGHVPVVFPSVTALVLLHGPHNRISVSALNGDGGRRHIFLLLIKDGEKANRRKEGVSLCTAAVKISLTPPPNPAPDPSRWVCHRSDLTGSKMAANQVTAARWCASDKRVSSPVHKRTQAYCVPTPSVVPNKLLNHCACWCTLHAEVGVFQLSLLNFTHLNNCQNYRSITRSPEVIFKNSNCTFGLNQHTFLSVLPNCPTFW